MSTSSSTESRGTETVEQLIGECFVKTAQAILSSRVYEPPAAGSKERNDKRSVWFKLNLQELESARQPLDRWRVERGVGLPLVLEIYLQPCSATSTASTSSEEPPGTLIERWYLHYCPSVTGLPLPLSSGGLSRSQMTRLSPQHVYKRLTLLIRSVYSYCRVLPAYKLYRTARASYRSPPFHLTYKLHSTLPQRGDAASSRMQRFEFSPVETADAKLHLVVEYQPASTIKVLGQTPVRLPRPVIIKDYVKEPNSLENKNTYLMERGKSQGISTATAAAAGGESSLTSAPSAPAALPNLASPSGSTPRRGWSSSFRHSPARIYEAPVYSQRQNYPSPVPGTCMPEKSAFAQTEISTTSTPTRAALTSPVQTALETQQRQYSQELHPHHQQKEERVPSPFEESSSGPLPINDDFELKKERIEVEEGSHVSSSPMAIPKPSSTQFKRRPHGFRSSGDLGALERRREEGGNGGGNGGGGGGDRQYNSKYRTAEIGDDSTGHENTHDKPMSAPALSYMQYISETTAAGVREESEDKRNDNESGVPSEKEDERKVSSKRPTTRVSAPISSFSSPEGARVTAQQHLPLPSLTVNITSQLPTYMEATPSSSYPVPSSPDLPFAFTPSARYSFSPASVASSSSGGGGRMLRSLSRPSPPFFSGSSGSDTHQFGAPTPPRLPPPTQMILPSNSISPSSLSNTNLSGREIPAGPAGTALMRRSSWGTRSIRGEGISLTPAVGYSISPIRDTMLDSVAFSASTPRNLLYTPRRAGSSDVFLTSSRSTGGGAAAGVSGGDLSSNNASKRDPLLLTFPESPSLQDAVQHKQHRGTSATSSDQQTAPLEKFKGATMEERMVTGMRLPREDSEILPFDFTADTSEQSSTDATSGIEGQQWQQNSENSPHEASSFEEHPHKTTTADASTVVKAVSDTVSGRVQPGERTPAAAAAFDVQSSAASIGAFMKLINEAQPLSGLAPIPLEVGLHQLDALRSKLSSYRDGQGRTGGI